MRKDFEQLFSHASPPQPPEGLFKAILLRIREERERMTARSRVFMLSAGTLFSSVAFVFAARMLASDLARSGTLQYLSLIFSDFTSAAAIWKDYLSSILETLPVISAAAMFAAAFAVLAMFRYLMRDLGRASPRFRLFNH